MKNKLNAFKKTYSHYFFNWRVYLPTNALKHILHHNVTDIFIWRTRWKPSILMCQTLLHYKMINILERLEAKHWPKLSKTFKTLLSLRSRTGYRQIQLHHYIHMENSCRNLCFRIYVTMICTSLLRFVIQTDTLFS